MTKLLLRLFVKDYDKADSFEVRSAVGSLSGIVGIICNALLFVLKLIVGTLSGSVSIIADGINNLSDATSSVVTLAGFRLAGKPADEEHPYGHARFEYLTGLIVSAIIIIIGIELAKTSVGKIINPSPVLFNVPVCIALVASILVKLWLYVFNTKLGKSVSSDTLLATAADSRNDIFATGAVLIAGIVQFVFGWHIDGIAGLAVAVFIVYSGAMLAKDIVSPLLGENASPELRNLIIEVVRSRPEVMGYHDLMVHDYGPGKRFASMHLEIDCRIDPMVSHEIIDNLERECMEKHNVHLVIHYDPIVTDDDELVRLRSVVSDILKEYDKRITIHDFRMVRGKEHTNLIFDIALPAELMKNQKAVKDELDKKIGEREEGTYYTVVDFDMDVFNN